MKRTILLTVCTGMAFFCSAQDVVKWSFTTKKIDDKTFEVHLTPTVQSPWHIYSQTSPEGGADPTRITFIKNPLGSMEGKTKEVGKIISKYEEVFDVTVKYFEGKADFVQTVTLRQVQGDKPIKTNISGSIEYMACNDEQCTPPTEVSF